MADRPTVENRRQGYLASVKLLIACPLLFGIAPLVQPAAIPRGGRWHHASSYWRLLQAGEGTAIDVPRAAPMLEGA